MGPPKRYYLFIYLFIYNRHEIDYGTKSFNKLRRLNELYEEQKAEKPYPKVQAEADIDATMGLVRFDNTNLTYQAMLQWLAETAPIVDPYGKATLIASDPDAYDGDEMEAECAMRLSELELAHDPPPAPPPKHLPSPSKGPQPSSGDQVWMESSPRTSAAAATRQAGEVAKAAVAAKAAAAARAEPPSSSIFGGKKRKVRRGKLDPSLKAPCFKNST